ncbi:hypothetical protein RhiirA1_477958 [Rhizophagus irregularis]|uniref:Uncharacterized protein n=1 Tax=Rhizophagus irregularis TaxID=588596 RepID=A0A2N0QST3_9GLOM|nr:hypothetical protein RhiirA1_477958 [Rhizophagus irregularis]
MSNPTFFNYNIKNSITKDVLDIDIRNSVEKNIHQIFEVNDDEVIKASTHQEICLGVI